jgi:hypothetical protein
MKRAPTTWTPAKVGDVVAFRKLTFQVGRKKTAVVLRIGRPVRSQSALTADPWWCPLTLDGLGDENSFFAVAGEDPLHALVLALEFVETVLPVLARKRGGRLYWLDRDWGIVFGATPRHSVKRRRSR